MSWENDENMERICPKTGRCVRPGRKRRLASWKLPLVGLVSLLWFLVRVIPKPSRVVYPCQRADFPLASGFVVWLTGAVVSRMACRKAKSLINIAPLSGHSMFGFTASGKNWFGSICWRNGGWTPSPLHNFGLRNNPMGSDAAKA